MTLELIIIFEFQIYHLLKQGNAKLTVREETHQ